MSPAPDSAQRDAAHQLDLTRRMREVEASILSRAPEHDLEPSLDRIRAVLQDGTSADRQLRVFKEKQSLRAVVDDLAEQTMLGA